MEQKLIVDLPPLSYVNSFSANSLAALNFLLLIRKFEVIHPPILNGKVRMLVFIVVKTFYRTIKEKSYLLFL